MHINLWGDFAELTGGTHCKNTRQFKNLKHDNNVVIGFLFFFSYSSGSVVD